MVSLIILDINYLLFTTHTVRSRTLNGTDQIHDHEQRTHLGR